MYCLGALNFYQKIKQLFSYTLKLETIDINAGMHLDKVRRTLKMYDYETHNCSRA
jgi:tRNA A37 threonylcarbamoyltransferase TsaD